jgi:hypothetical protein
MKTRNPQPVTRNRRRVTPEDLVNVVVMADDLKRRSMGFQSTRAADWLRQGRPSLNRTFVEPFFNVLGLMFGQGLAWTPRPLRRRAIQWLNVRFGRHAPEENPRLTERIREALDQAKMLQRKTGRWPAVLVLTSHPETTGDLQWLRFEVLRQGLQLADALVEANPRQPFFRSHPKVLLAIDPFALDTVSAAIGGFYAAAMHRLYLAWDRQSSLQPWIQRHILLGDTHYSNIGWRLLETLRNDVPVIMVLAGGLPFNARLLYGVREFVHRMPIRKWNISKRQAQKGLMELLTPPEDGVWPADEGRVPPSRRERVIELWRSWGLEQGFEESCWRSLLEEFQPAVPLRSRFFRVLLERLVAKGKPLMLIPVAHGSTPPHVQVGSPVSLAAMPDDVARFARDFVLANFQMA